MARKKCEGRVSGRGKGKYKDPKTGTSLMYLRSRKNVRDGWSNWAKFLDPSQRGEIPNPERKKK